MLSSQIGFGRMLAAGTGWSPSSMVGGAVGFLQIMREVDLGEVTKQLQAPVRIVLTGEDQEAVSQLAAVLGGEPASPDHLRVLTLDRQVSPATERTDLVIVALPASAEAREAFSRLQPTIARWPAPVLAIRWSDQTVTRQPERWRIDHAMVLDLVTSGQAQVRSEISRAVLELIPGQALALGRHFPALRGEVAEDLIRATSRANAEFALVSSLPASIPFIGGLASSAADMLVLTKNQALLVYKLAGLHHRNLDDRVALALEIAPVVGGAFFWRSVARALLAYVPGLLGGVPKAAVAYTGTYTVGQLAQYYYAAGKRPPPELARRFQAEGARLARQLVERLRKLGRGRPAPD